MPTLLMAQSSWTQAYEMSLNGSFVLPSITGEVQSNPNAGQFGGFVVHSDRASFEAATMSRADEDFEMNLPGPSTVTGCSIIINSMSNDACFTPGNIIAGVDFGHSGIAGENMVLLEAGAGANPTSVIGPNTFTNNMTIGNLPALTGGSVALGVAFDLFVLAGGAGATVTVMDMNGGSTVTNFPAVAGTPVFYGVTSSVSIVSVNIEATDPAGGELIDNFALAPDPNLPVE